MNDSTRRTFIKVAAAATAASQAHIFGANDRIRIGGIGTGGRGQYLLSVLSKLPGNEIVAVCDVYEPNRTKAKRDSAPNAREVADFHEILEDKSIDAVVIAAPDHWHVPMVIAAVKAGKDVYVEKPVTHSMEEGAALQKAVDDSGRVVQVGMQQRSWPHYFEAKSIIESCELGQITYIRTYWYQNHLGREKSVAGVDLSKLDWKLWLGNAPQREADARRFAQWRWFWDYGGGSLTDLFAHWVDVVHWTMHSETPSVATALGGSWAMPGWECPDTVTASFEYPGKASNFSVSYDGSLIGYREGGGMLYHGTKGILRLHRAGFWLYPELPRYSENPDMDVPAKTVKSTRDGAEYHMENFLDCVRSRKTPNASVAAGIAAARAGQLGNVALREKRVVTYPA
jgi:predicted dehydrogenase